MQRLQQLAHLVKSYLKNDDGTVVVMTALMAPVMIAGLGLGVETGHWYQKQRHLQHMADVSSFSGAAKLQSGGDQGQISASANSIALMSGYDPNVGTVQVFSPPTSGTFAGDESAVEVIITEHRKRWFSAIYSSDDIEIVGRAVSRIEGGDSQACMLALSKYDHFSIYVTGNADVVMPDCVAATNSTSPYAWKIWGNASSMEVACGHSAGGAWIFNQNNLDLTACNSVKTYAGEVADPYADVAEPAASGWCQYGRVGKNNRTTVVTPTDSHSNGMKSRRYCGGLSLKGTVYFEPGLYIIDGGTFRINSNSKIYSKEGGVTFYLVNGATLNFNGTATIDLTAPSNGPTSGLLFFGSRSTGTGGYGSCSRAYGTEHVINGNSNSSLHGAVYLPANDLIFAGNSNTTNACTQIIANTIKMIGNSDVGITCENSGTEEIVVSELVKLVE